MIITIYYLRRVTDVSSVLSYELAHIESIEDRSGWLLVALYISGKGSLWLLVLTCMI